MPSRPHISPSLPTAGPRHFAGIDVIRGLCIMNVVLHHTNIRIHFASSTLGARMPHALINALFWTGDYSVKVFFVVSGFLITNSILARWQELGMVDCLTFYRLRFARIAPCLLALLAILAVLHWAHVPGFTINPSETTLWHALFAALTFHINWLEARVGYLPGCWDVLWSLSVEETFYLAYPVLCRHLRTRFLLPGVAAILLVAGPIARTTAFNTVWEDYSYLGGMDAIAVGCLTSIVAQKNWIRRIPGWFFALTGILLILSVWFRGLAEKLKLLSYGIDVTILGIGAALVILGIVRSDKSFSNKGFVSGPATALFRWYGRNSYEIYLTHMFVVLLGVRLFHGIHASVNLAPAWFLLILGIAGMLGYAVARWFSEPMNRRLRAALIVSPSQTQALAATAQPTLNL